MVFEVLRGSAAEEAKSGGVIVAAIDAARPDTAVAGLQEDGVQFLHDALPDLDLGSTEPEFSFLPNARDLPAPSQESPLCWSSELCELQCRTASACCAAV